MYSLLLVFWVSIFNIGIINIFLQANLLQKNETPRGWINKRLKKILIGITIALVVLLTLWPVIAVIPGIEFIVPLVNGLFVLIVLAFTITMAMEGMKVTKLIKSMDNNSNSNSQEILQTVTKLVVGSSGALILVMVALIITTLMRLPKDNSPYCMASLLLYRVLEVVVMIVLTAPLRHSEMTSPTNTPMVTAQRTSTKTESGIIE